jgi:hypothetical protein
LAITNAIIFMKSIYFSLPLACAAAVTASCNRPANDESTGATNLAPASASNAWQSAQQNGSNAWEAAKGAATNTFEAAKAAGSNVWQKAQEVLGSGDPTVEAPTNYFGFDYPMKGAFVAEAKASVDQLNQDAATLSNRVANANANTKADLQQTLQEIQVKRTELEKNYGDIKNASPAAWDDAKAAFVKSYYDLRGYLKAGWDTVSANKI